MSNEMKSSINDVMSNMMTKLFDNYDKTCPRCGEQLWRPKAINKATGKHFSGACISCGYKEELTGPDTTLTSQQMTIVARKNSALGYLKRNSVFANKAIMSCSLTNYHTNTDGQKRALTFSRQIASQCAQANQPVHCMLLGQTGVGKSHLAMGILMSYLEQTGYTKKAAFIDWSELINQMKSLIGNDNQDTRKFVNNVVSEYANSDLIVIDDLGSERITEYNLDAVKRIFSVREDKHIIMTTNVNGTELKARYDDRTMSRMSKHGAGNTLLMKNISDYRLAGATA